MPKGKGNGDNSVVHYDQPCPLGFRSIKDQHPALLLGDFKRFTSKAVVKAIQENPRESRKEFLLEQFKKAGAKSSKVKELQFWRHDNKPTELWSNPVIWEKIHYWKIL